MALERSLVDKLRLFVGFVILPVVDALLAYAIHRVVWSTGPYEGAQWGDPVDAAVAFAAGTGIIAFIVTWTGVVPTVTFMLRRGRLSLGRLVIAGVALGNAPFAIAGSIMVLLFLAGVVTSTDVGYTFVHGPVGAVRAVAIGSVMGAASAWLFWVVAIFGTGYGRTLAGK